MIHSEKVKGIQQIRPDSQFVLRGDELDWLDTKTSKPTEEEIAEGWIAYQAKIESDKSATEAKRQALLDRLGITAEEAKLLLG
jgi:hypothetical protein